MKECCKLLKKCTADNYRYEYDPECHPVYSKVWVNKYSIIKFPKKNPKYWTWNFGMFPDDVDGMYRGMKVCNLSNMN
uniref:Uncharacterized protein n=1 Tax=Meloidogyne enterolobii TaxID=390850 RepID=A0A6V7VW54_MELEN|nr:unnamed protein product [Meloidogyne enterolobii]